MNNASNYQANNQTEYLETLQALLAQRLPFWINLSAEQQKAVVTHTRYARFSAGDQVRNPSTPAGVMLVLLGSLRAYMLSD